MPGEGRLFQQGKPHEQGWEGKEALLLHPFKPRLSSNSCNSQEQRLCQVEEGWSSAQGINTVLVGPALLWDAGLWSLAQPPQGSAAH